jgi:hypothetical protein
VFDNPQKNFTRIIYALASLSMALDVFLDIVINQKEIIIGIVISCVFLLGAFMFLVRSNFISLKRNIQEDPSTIQSADFLGFLLVIYLFYMAIF